MQIPSRDLTSQYISASYEDVLQQYSSSSLYVLDGLGNVVFIIPSASIGQTLITSDVTSSMMISSASHSDTSIYSDTASLSLYSEYSGTSSISLESLTASYVVSMSATAMSIYNRKIYWDNTGKQVDV